MEALAEPPPVQSGYSDGSERDCLTSRKNSLGSHYLAFHTDRETVLAFAALNLENLFRRVVLDPVQGLIMLMSPGRVHETTREQIGDVVKDLIGLLGLKRASLGSTRLRRITDPDNTGIEPDCCYYVGEKAQAYRQAEREGDAAADNYVLHHPLDMIIEIGVTHEDRDKLEIYHDLGVLECWQVNRPVNAGMSVRFLNPQDSGARALPASRVLPEITPAVVLEAFQALQDLDNALERQSALREILQRHRVMQVTNRTVQRPSGSGAP